MQEKPDEGKPAKQEKPKSWPFIPYSGKPLNWQEEYGSWENFMHAVRKSIGGYRGSGKIQFIQNHDSKENP